MLTALAAPAAAQSGGRSTAARAAQFVLVIDDSTSMRETDPDRLSVFAARSLLSMLDDHDQVSVVRMNGPRAGVAPPPIQPLSVNRATLERLLDLGDELASYGVGATACRSSLAAVRRLLDAAYQPGVAQVVILLTDGECYPAATEDVDVDGFLSGLRSRQERSDLFQFYPLRFQGFRYSSALDDLAGRTGGKRFEANASDPASILRAFADAFSRSQGYEADLLSPREARLRAHRGAERVRLLAVAPGAGDQLSFSVRNAGGGAPQLLGAPRAGTHQYPRGRIFRYAALDYRPNLEPVEIEVTGAGGQWSVIALPEYRLMVRGSVHDGDCAHLGAPVESVDVGASVCAVVDLVNAAGEPVGDDVTGGGLEARLRATRADQPDGPAVDLATNPLEPGQARFGVPRSHLARGDYALAPFVRLQLSSGDVVELTGPQVALEVASVEILPQPDRFAFGTLRPGDLLQRPLVLGGNFPRTQGHLELGDRADLPACITVELNGVPEGQAQPITPGQAHNLMLRVSPYCAPRSIRRQMNTTLKVVLDAAGGRSLPVVALPLTLLLDYRFEAPKRLRVLVRGGHTADLPLAIAGNFQTQAALRAVIGGPEDAEEWPEKARHLTFGFAGKRQQLRRDDHSGPVLLEDFSAGPGADPLRLRVHASACCPEGSYRTVVAINAAGSQPLPPGARPPEPLVIPARIDVEAAGLWACYGLRILIVLLALLLLLLVAYVANMFRNSSFLKPEGLAGLLKPLVWTDVGDAVPRPNVARDVQALVRRSLPLTRRAGTWLRANPLRFGLPGGRYRETVELHLVANRDVNHSRIVLTPDGDVQARASSDPEALRRRLFAIAGGVLLAVPDEEGRVGTLVLKDGPAVVGDDERPVALRATRLRRKALVRRLESWEAPEQGAPAGWQVG
ncbi:MAG TPA: vWA domain-containing protein [Thermoanaerobaculia bacterium]|nr:vWA domain-containing protein [Thermoanaerobaculia bacterium]